MREDLHSLQPRAAPRSANCQAISCPSPRSAPVTNAKTGRSDIRPPRCAASIWVRRRRYIPVSIWPRISPAGYFVECTLT
jgi:hypothetical protein